MVFATIWNGTNSSGWRGEDNLQADTACVYASSAQPRLLLLLWGRAFSAGSPPPVFLPIEQPEFQST